MTTIEWTDDTWNPVTGCTKVSQGCKNCYAERLAPKVFAGQVIPGDGRPRKFTDVMEHYDRLYQPLRWKRQRRIFVNSMSDLFHEDVGPDFIADVFAAMALSRWHTFQVLTKRAARMLEIVSDDEFRDAVDTSMKMMLRDEDRPPSLAWNANERLTTDAMATAPDVCGDDWPLPNVWLGVSCEDQATADERIQLLLQTPAAVRFVSAEPLLGPIDFRRWTVAKIIGGPGEPTLYGLDWIIVGGESGPGARPFDVAWARSIIGQCKAASVPVFMKQIGTQPRGWCEWNAPEHIGAEDAAEMRAEDSDGDCVNYEASEQREACPGRCAMLRDRKGGDMNEWPADLRVREFPA